MASREGQTGKGAEQRRFARVPINLDGLLSIGGRPAVPCTARDFCDGGMFISADPATYANVEPQTPAELYFALFIGEEKHDFQIALTIARAVSKGIGVSFRDPDPKTLEFLQMLAAPAAGTQPPESGESLGETQQGFAAEFAAVSEPLKTLVGEHTTALCERFVERVDDVLFLAARDAGNNADETRFLDGQREVRGRRDRLLKQVPAKIELGLSILGNPLSDAEEEEASPGLSDLSLVEKDDFEDFLAVSEMVSELEPEFIEPLFALCRRFTYLANREVNKSALPIGPGVLCNAIADCLKGLQSEKRVNKRIYQVLHEVMSGNLGKLYEAVNALLVEHGVVPVIEKDKPVIKKKPSAGGFDAPVDDAPEDSLGEPGTAPEDEFANLMPSPDNYQGRPSQYAPARSAPQVPASGGVQAAPPVVPPGMVVQPAPPAVPPGMNVQGAPPSVPAGGVQGAPPTMPAGGVQGAPPTMPAGGVQGAPPSVPAGGVQGAPPTMPAGGVQGAPPTMPAGGVQGAPPSVPTGGVQGAPPGATAATGAGYAGGVQLPAGWVSPGVQYAPPSMSQAYSTAQTQLALRRQIGPVVPPGLTETVQQRGAYSASQLLEGLADLQHAFAETTSPELMDVDGIRRRITDALIGDGAPERMIDDEANSAIEVVANLFSALLQDALVPKGAKSHLSRLQPSVHRAALMDSQFFESEDHPVRQVINRISQVRDGKGDADKARHERVTQLVQKANQEFRNDVSVFEPIVSQLDDIITEQRGDYDSNIKAVVESCEEHQRILEERRGQSLEATDGGLDRSDFPEEWSKWLDRARGLEMGEKMLMNANTANPFLVTLIWKEARNTLFVFVDELGNKASSLTLEQVAMYLRRGVIRDLERDQDRPAMDRAMFGVVDRFHTQVENQATRDALTGFLTRKYFVEAIDDALPEGEQDGAKDAVLAQISVENLKAINTDFGDAAGDALLEAVAAALREQVRGKDIAFGRIGGTELAVFWPAGGLQSIYKRLQGQVEKLSNLTVKLNGDAEPDPDQTADPDAATVVRAVTPVLVVGLTGTRDGLEQAEGLLSAAAEACVTARESGPGAIYVSGSESEQRRQMEQMVAYANKALERDRLLLYGQHLTSLTDEDLPPALHVAVGALDRGDKRIPANLFAPALVRCQAAAEVDLWAFRRTLQWMTAHEEEVEAYAFVVLPLSPASIRNEDLPHLIMTEFMETPVPPGRICFAIPDRDVVENTVEASELVSTLKEFGCRFVLDEFGSGHENYDYVKELDVDYVTVKSAFVTDARQSPKDFAMAKSINELVHFMGKKTIAKQDKGLDLAGTMREIGIDFLYDLAERSQLEP